MASTSQDPRPLSPHLGVWRFHITMVTSILHRITGVGLYLGAAVLTVWLAAAAAGPDAYATVEGLLLSPVGRLVLFGLTLSGTYHLANGIRHLVWDTGAGFALKSANASAWFALIFSVLATLGVWAAAYSL